MDQLVLCVDRDDDVGRKIKFHGPIVGVRKNLEVAQKLALADPEDSDVNAIYAAVKIAKELGCEIATLTGDYQVGVKSDRKISEQLDKVLSDTKAKSVIFVTDGAEDEQLLPIIQSRVKITSVRTVIVRQSKELEKAYFTITNFLKEVTDDPNLARLLFGVPGVVLLLLAIGGSHAINIILGIVGLYLIVRGLGYEELLFEHAMDFVRSLSLERISTYTYAIALLVFLVGAAYGYDELNTSPVDLGSVDAALNSLNAFILNSIADDLVIGAFVVAVLGRVMDDVSSKRFLAIRRNLVLLAFIALVGSVLSQGARFWIEENYSLTSFMLRVLVYVAAFWVWIKITHYWFTGEIEEMRQTIEALAGKEVYTSDGKKVGKVSKVYLDGVQLKAIKVKGRKIDAKEVISTDRVVVVNAE